MGLQVNVLSEGYKERVLGADLVLVDGKVVTVDGDGTVAEAVAVKDGRVLAVGSTNQIKELANSGTETIDLEGRLMLPGFPLPVAGGIGYTS